MMLLHLSTDFDALVASESDLAAWAEHRLEWATPTQDYQPLSWLELRLLFDVVGHRTAAVIARPVSEDPAPLPHVQARGVRNRMIVEVAPDESEFACVGRSVGSRVEIPFYDSDGERFVARLPELLTAVEASIVAASWLAGREVPEGFAITREDPGVAFAVLPGFSDTAEPLRESRHSSPTHAPRSPLPSTQRQ
jgi:hypothetical protein